MDFTIVNSLSLHNAPPLCALFLLKIELKVVNSPSLHNAPPSLCAVFTLKVESVIFNFPLLTIAPPSSFAVFSANVDLLIVNCAELVLYIAPPAPRSDAFLINLDSFIISTPSLNMAPPLLFFPLVMFSISRDSFIVTTEDDLANIAPPFSA